MEKAKATLLILICLITFSCCSDSRKRSYSDRYGSTVYVCTGGYSKRYHATEDCRGLFRCCGEIIEMSVDEAKKNGRTACRICNKAI